MFVNPVYPPEATVEAAGPGRVSRRYSQWPLRNSLRASQVADPARIAALEEAAQWGLEEQKAEAGASSRGSSEFDEKIARAQARSELEATQVVGTTSLYDEDGQLRLIPMPTPDPKDPLNMPNWRKWVAIGVLCFFGSLALAAEIVIGSLLPIFVLEYAGVDPRTIRDVQIPTGAGINLNPLAVLPPGVEPPNLPMVVLIITVPFLANGVASYLLIPLSIAIGRRPVLLLSALCACAGGLWAGLSPNLNQHVVARIVGGLGAGAVEALIPLIVSDIMFIHQRNRAVSAIIASQGVFIIGLGVAAPYIAANYDWRWIYYITSGFGFVAWFLLIGLLPETRWLRSKAELAGQKVYHLEPGQNRPALDHRGFTPRTLWTDLGVFQFGFAWHAAGLSMLDTLRTTLFPNVLWCVAANTVLNVANSAAQQVAPFALVAQGWQFQWTGLSVVPFVLASVLVYLFAGPAADAAANRVTRWNRGHREPEHHLVNLVLPLLTGIAGCLVFGYAGQNDLHWALVLLGSFLIIFGFLTVMSVLNVFIVESYPMWAGPVLVNVSSLRLVLSFFFSSQSTEWIQEKGMLQTFAIYAEALIVIMLGLPLFFFFGKKIRKWTAGKVKAPKPEKSFAEL